MVSEPKSYDDDAIPIPVARPILYRSKSAQAYSFVLRKRRSGSRPLLVKGDEINDLLNHDLSDMQLGVMDACQKLEGNLREIHVSEVLPAAHDLMFINITTLEGEPYCLERTQRGWRICSCKHDSMHGDLQHIELHILYFDDADDAVARVSPAYQKVLERLSETDCERLQFE